MCPPVRPSSPAEIGMYWSDEQIVALLDEYTPGSDLPSNVLTDLSPYQYPPSNLPEGIWYLLNLNEKKESKNGFWKAKGEACKIYSNSMISGWRTTLEYFEGEAPHGQRTNWHMQEYMITQTELLGDKDKPKESRLLCRVFLCSGCTSKSEMQPEKCKTTVIESKKIDSVVSLVPNTNIISDQDHRSKSKEDYDVERLMVEADKMPNSSLEVFSELECLSRGDYLELNDLEDDPESHSSSSQNSSCPSKLSDECFDSLALLRDLEDEDNIYMQPKQSDSRYSFTTLVKPNDVVLQLSSPVSGTRSTNIVEGSPTNSTIHGTQTDERVLEHTTKRHNPESRNEGTPSTSHKNSNPSGEKKAGSRRMKKLKMYFCFTPFD
ncbi:hypothetical protein BUALT_Bualt01G0035000 [Buddleja alternifolia]|uniref:NAC domain-containing protein n=1 Tax=Buddleja alternifolia TaxID=168488 RepID=A0AAV6YCS6_9LAMI|nr:hypothetical protein BUALT_Bualt01G0035000 [Buddleja alternifolia]